MTRNLLMLLIAVAGIGAVAGALGWRPGPHRVRRTPRVDVPVASYITEVRALPWNDASSVSDPRGGFVGYSTMRGDGYDGWHTLTVLDAGSGAGIVRRVVTFREADPGSGRSHWLGWSSDGRALLVGGHGSLDGESPAPLCLIYLPASDELFRPAACER